MTGRSIFRVLRWAGLAAVAPVLWACNARTLEAPNLKPSSVYTKPFQQSVNRNVDLLFLVDDSPSMRDKQANLRRNFPSLIGALRKIKGGLPDVHIAVATSEVPRPRGGWRRPAPLANPLPRARRRRHRAARASPP